MPNILETHCCGLGDLAGIQDGDVTPEQCVTAVLNDQPVAFVTFAQATFNTSSDLDSPEDVRLYKHINGAGKRLAAYIRKHKLGSVTGGSVHRNPNSGNPLRVWLWALDREAIRKWYNARKSKPRVSQPRRGET